MPANRKRHDAYGVYILNDVDGATPQALHRVTTLSVTTDQSVDGIMELTNEGMVEWKADVPVSTISLGGNQIAKMIEDATDEDTGVSPLHWLGLLAGQDALGTDRVKIFVIGDPKYAGTAGSTSETSMFDTVTTSGGNAVDVTADMLIPVRGASGLEATVYIAQLAVTSLSLSFSVDGYAEWSADLEADNYHRFQNGSSDWRGVTATAHTVVAPEDDNNEVSLPGASDVMLVYLNGEELIEVSDESELGSASQGYRRWYFTGTSIKFSDGLIAEGDFLRIVYLPTTPKAWSDYALATGPGDQGAIRRGELDIYLITDTTAPRIIEGFVPSLSEATISVSAGSTWIASSANGDLELIYATDTTGVTLDASGLSDGTHTVYLSYNGSNLSLTTSNSGNNTVAVASVIVSDGAITSFSDARDFKRNSLSLVQTASFSIDLSREVIYQLGDQRAVSRSLNRPVTISADVTALDYGDEIVTLLSGGTVGSTNSIDFDSMSNRLGIQVNLYSSTDRTDDNKTVVFEATDMRPTSVGNTISTGASGEVSFTLNGDTFVALECASVS